MFWTNFVGTIGTMISQRASDFDPTWTSDGTGKSWTSQEWDKDKDGRLDYREFAAIFQHLGAAKRSAKRHARALPREMAIDGRFPG